MTHRIRRHSMEHLELYDLDILTINPSLPPPLPAPRKHQRHEPSNSTSERHQFLWNIERNKTDPIYVATPMFTTIPKSSHVKHHQQLLGSYVPPRMFQPLTPTSLKFSEPQTPNIDNDDDSSDKDQSSSSSSTQDNRSNRWKRPVRRPVRRPATAMFRSNSGREPRQTRTVFRRY
jgi:hypothetical protein